MSSVVGFLLKSSGVMIAPILFGIGLSAPLTPSEGRPELINVLIYWIAPLIILSLAWVKPKEKGLRITSAALFLMVFIPYAYLLFRMSQS